MKLETEPKFNPRYHPNLFKSLVALLLVPGLGACGTPVPQSEQSGCTSAVAGVERVVSLDPLGRQVAVPGGWVAQAGTTAGATTFTAGTAAGDTVLTVVIAGPDVADMLPIPGATIVGASTIDLADRLGVEASVVTEDQFHGYQVVLDDGSGGAIEISVRGKVATCDATMRDAMKRVTVGN